MAKKSTAARQGHTSRRPQTTAKPAEVTLVRTPKTSDTSNATNTTHAVAASADATPPTSTPARSAKASAATVERPRAPEVGRVAKPAPKVDSAVRQQAAKTQANRIARARAMQQARTANLITPEHYSYVLGDLKFIGVLAALMFIIIIVLHFVLPL